eukprot:1194982-Prorocentrum_minimum.AAC.12
MEAKIIAMDVDDQVGHELCDAVTAHQDRRGLGGGRDGFEGEAGVWVWRSWQSTPLKSRAEQTGAPERARARVGLDMNGAGPGSAVWRRMGALAGRGLGAGGDASTWFNILRRWYVK